ncbi:MAG: hypothetical protein ACRDFC_08605 [Ignavibacteria bacterium]
MNSSPFSLNKNKFPPAYIHLIYISASIVFCLLYYLKIVTPADFGSASSIDAVLSFETNLPFQYRLLFPFFFKPLSLAKLIPDKTLFLILSIILVYLIIIMYYYLISEYFQNGKINYFLALVIVYPMLWNYVILNQTFQYYDLTAVLFFTAGLYLIASNNFKFLFIIFVLAVLNKESAVYLVFCYILYNYRDVFTKSVLGNSVILVVSFIIIKLTLYLIFKDNPGDPVEYTYRWNTEIINNLFTNRVYIKNVFLNFGLLYIFPILIAATAGWKKFDPVNYGRTFIFFTLFIYIAVGFFIVYYTEVRVYSELIPVVSTTFLIYLSTFNNKYIRPLIKSN